MAVAFVSPPISPILSPTNSISGSRRRLSSRRGSITAYDPWNTFAANVPSGHAQTSKLTIVRMDPQLFLQDELSFQPRLPARSSSGRNHRRTGSGASTSSTGSYREREKEKERVSFAFSTFSPPPSPKLTSRQALRSPVLSAVRPRSGSGSGRSLGGRNRSPSFTSTCSSEVSRRPLSPDELVDLARQSLYPSLSPGPTSPLAAAAVSPAVFTPLTDNILLPFVDRPAEVRSLLTSAPTSRLWLLLQQSFPVSRTVSSFNPSMWTFAQLENWMTTVGRDGEGSASDEVWVRKARSCVRARSELIWERLKGALGVPPELDEDVFVLEVHEEEPVFVEEVMTSSPSMENCPRMSDILEDDDIPEGEKPEESVRGLRFSTTPRTAVFNGNGMSDSISNLSTNELYDVVAERGPGNPLFPSSFARLTLAPTLAAK